MVGNAQLKVVGISGFSVKWTRQARRFWKDLREKIGKGEYKIPYQVIEWLLLEERILPSKQDILCNCFKERVLCQGK